MDTTVPLKRSPDYAGLDSPRENKTRSAPKISKARACESSPHHLRYPQINGEQAQNASAIRFAASFEQEKQLVQNVPVAVSSAS